MSTQLKPSGPRRRKSARKPRATPRKVTSTQSSAPPFELLESKLLPPQGRGGAVLRGEVISSLEGSRGTPVVCLSAGPGWGKTTLLAQWRSRSQRPFAWVSVDEHDNDPIVLLTYVAAALDRVSPLDPGVFDALASPGVSVEATVVPRLGAALTEVSEPVVVVLDDLHVLDSRASLDAIEALTRHVPKGSQMALSARGGPVLPLAASRARGLVLEIGPDDLRMDEAEAGQLLSAAGLDLPDDRVAELTEQTEGWSAGLYLAALSLRARGHRAKGATTFSGSDRLVSEYLRSELLEHLSADDRRFLTRTAVLERMSGPLCDAVLEETGSAAALESLAGSNLFLVPLDANGEWYRYHHLFQELLRLELARAEPDLAPSLLARASAWCEANGQPEAAVAYAQEAGDVDRVARLVERYGLADLPRRSWSRPPSAGSTGWRRRGHSTGTQRSRVLGALLATVRGRPAQAERWAEAAERAAYDGTLPDGSPSIDSWLALLRAQRCHRGVTRMGDGRGARGPDARPCESLPAERRAAPRGLAPPGRRDRPSRRPPRRRRRGGPRGGKPRGGGGGAGRACRSRDRTRTMGRGRGVRRPSAQGHPPFATRGVPPQRIRLRAGGPRRAPSRGSRARRRAPRPSTTPSAASSRTRCRTYPCRPAWSLRAPT